MTQQNSPAISVIIPCKDHAEELHACLIGLQQMEVAVPFEVITVDSDENDDVKAVSQNFPNIKLVRSKDNLRAGSARNLGASQATGNHLAFIDADCIPSPQWLDAAREALSAGAQMVGGPVVDALPKNSISVVDNLLQFADLAPNRPQSTVDVLPACNLALNKTAFDLVGGFPDALYIEDSLFTNSVSQHWQKLCWFLPKMVVAHKGRTSLNDLIQHQNRFGYARGLHGFRVKEAQQKLGSHFFSVPLIVLKRFVYIYLRTFQWNRVRILGTIALFPIVLLGLFSWAIGFRNGCRDSVNRNMPQENK